MINRIIAVYPGRFQPMGRHHKTTYDWMVSNFGAENSFIDAFTDAANDYEEKRRKRMGLPDPFGVGRPGRFRYEAYDIAGRIALKSHKLDFHKDENYSNLYDEE